MNINNAKCRILIANQDEELAVFLQGMLYREGFDVLLAKDGKELSNMIEKEENPPRFALFGLSLPHIDGMQIIKKIRENPAWQSTVIIVFTDSINDDDAVTALNNGADDYIKRPFNPKVLLAKLSKLCEKKVIGE